MISGTAPSGRGRVVVISAVVAAGAMLAGLLLTPVLMFASGGLLSLSGTACSTARGGKDVQPVASKSAANSIPADYLALFQRIGAQYSVPWVILAGIGKVESDDGRSTLPGVHSAANAFGAAGPMQIGISGAAGDQWGGAPVHPASEKVDGVATDADGDGIANVYDPADAIAGAAKYLLAHGVLDNVQQAIFAYNHLESYVQTVLYWAGLYARGGYSVSPVTLDSAPGCIPGAATVPNNAAAAAIAFAEAQIGKPYLWGGTGPDAFDCSGLVMMAYRAAGRRHTAHLAGAVGLGPADQPQSGAARGSGVLRRRGRHRAGTGSRRDRDRPRAHGRGLRDRVPDPDRALHRPGSGRFHPALGAPRRDPGQFSLEVALRSPTCSAYHASATCSTIWRRLQFGSRGRSHSAGPAAARRSS